MRTVLLHGMSLLLLGCLTAPEYDIAIENVSVVDVETGDVLAHRHLGIRDGKIAYIGPDPQSAELLLTGSGHWAIPGLWDMHVHIADPSYFPLFVANGIVGVRDMGGSAPSATDGCESIDLATLRSWQSQIRSGIRLGPDIVAAGPILTGTDFSSGLDATSPASARDSVRKAADAGADFVKLYENISLEALTALADAAKMQGLQFAGHVSEETLRIVDAIRLGQRSIEHVRANLILCFADTDSQLQQLLESDNWNIDDRLWAARHVDSCPEVWTELRASDVWLTPTLAVQETLEAASLKGFEKDPRRSSLPDSIIKAVEQRSQILRDRTPEELAEAENWNRFVHRLVGKANKQDVKMLAGSDAACEGTIPGHSLHRELELLVVAGLSNLKALQTATLEPSKYLGREGESGKIAVGYEADIILLDGNPLESIGNSRLVSAVIIDGDWRFKESKLIRSWSPRVCPNPAVLANCATLFVIDPYR